MAYELLFFFFFSNNPFRFDLSSDPTSEQQLARLRVCIVLRYWLANPFVDFNEVLLRNVNNFITYRIMPVLTSAAQTLLQIIERRVHVRNILLQRKYSHDAPPGRCDPTPRPLLSPERWTVKLITTLPPLEVARQLTLIGSVFSSATTCHSRI